MKNFCKSAMAGLFVVSAVACATGESESGNEGLAPAAAPDSVGAQQAALEERAATVEGVEAADAGRAGDDSDATLGKECTATCSVVQTAAGAFCPSSIGGFGSTTFLGGCDKACRKARADASGQLGPGCAIFNCDLACSG